MLIDNIEWIDRGHPGKWQLSTVVRDQNNKLYCTNNTGAFAEWQDKSMGWNVLSLWDESLIMVAIEPSTNAQWCVMQGGQLYKYLNGVWNLVTITLQENSPFSRTLKMIAFRPSDNKLFFVDSNGHLFKNNGPSNDAPIVTSNEAISWTLDWIAFFPNSGYAGTKYAGASLCVGTGLNLGFVNLSETLNVVQLTQNWTLNMVYINDGYLYAVGTNSNLGYFPIDA